MTIRKRTSAQQRHVLLPLIATAGLALASLPLPAWAQQSSVVVANAMDIETFDPSREWSGTSLMVFHMVYDTLTAYSADGSDIVPLLAASWTASEDNATFTFSLDPDARFSDGTPVEAKDVIFSLERAKNVGIAGFLYEGIEQMEAPTPDTVEITLSESNSEFPALLASSISAILNSDVVMEQGGTTDPATDLAEAWLISNSAGSGPFVLESYDPGNVIVLSKNENFWREAPAYDRFVMQNVQDPASQALLLETGGADIAMGLDGASAGTITDESVTIQSSPSAYAIYLIFGPGVPEAEGNLTPKVREAIVSAINFQGLIDDLAEGKGRIQPGIIPIDFAGGDGLPEPEYSVERARALMEEAGITGRITLPVTYIDETSAGISQTLLMQRVGQDLAEIGIDLELRPVSEPVMEQARAEGTAAASIVAWAPDYAGMVPYVTTFGLYEDTWVDVMSALHNAEEALIPETPQMLNEALTAGGEELEAIIRDLSQRTMDKNIVLPLMNPDLIRGLGPNVASFNCSWGFNCRFAEIELR